MFKSYNFKKVFSEEIVTIDIPTNLKICQVRDYIKEKILNEMNIRFFAIIEAGTVMSENNLPINENEGILFCDKYNNLQSFYIKPINLFTNYIH